MQVEIDVNELDILQIQSGQTATIELDAVEDQTYEGTVTDISGTGSNSGGTTTYPVTVELDKDENMLAGMSASATITISQAEDVLTIPAAALQEEGGTTYVYTSQEDDGTLSGKTEVTTGESNDSTVEITDGLTEGQTVYYSLGTGENVSSSETTGSAMNFNMGGGQGSGQGGGQPSGGGPGGNGS